MSYFSTISTLTEPRFIFLDFKKYSLALEGISIYTANVDWFAEYNLEVSLDMISISSKTTISCSDFPNVEWQHFSFPKTKPSRYINLSVDLNTKTNKGTTNFAIHLMEFFGEILHTKTVLKSLFKCTKDFKIKLFNLVPYQIILLTYSP